MNQRELEPRCYDGAGASLDSPPWPNQQLGFYFRSPEARLGGDQNRKAAVARRRQRGRPLLQLPSPLPLSPTPTPRPGKAQRPLERRECREGAGDEAQAVPGLRGAQRWAPRGGRGAGGAGQCGPTPGGREGGGVSSAGGARSLAGVCWCGAEAGAGGRGARGARRREEAAAARVAGGRAGGRAAGIRLVNKLRCCLGLAGLGFAAAAARERRS